MPTEISFSAASAVRRPPFAGRGDAARHHLRASSPVERMQVLVVEPDQALSEWIVAALRRDRHAVELVTTAAEAIRRLCRDRFDAVLLDRALDRDGLDVLREVRASGIDTPILVASVHGRVRDRVEGLESGADDYLVKPFAISELVARLRVLARRRLAARGVPADTVSLGRLALDLASGELHDGDRKVALRPHEAGLLALLMHAREQPVARETVLAKVWDEDDQPSAKAVDQSACRLRSGLFRAAIRARILAVRGIGYRLQVLP